MKHQIFNRIRVFAGTIVFIGVVSVTSLACITPGSLIGGVDPENYVLIGKVSNYTLGVSLPNRQNPVFGFEVVPTGLVFPAKLPKQIQIYPLRSMVDCRLGGLSESELRRKYPIGSEIKVVGRRATQIRSSVKSELIIEAGYVDHTFVALNSTDESVGRNTIEAEFDYRTADDSFLSTPAARYYFVAFEVQKDLVRLASSKPPERQIILNRLRHAPDYARIDFGHIESSCCLNVPTKIVQ